MNSLGTFVKRAPQCAQLVKNPPASGGDTRDMIQSLGQEDPLEQEMANHCSIIAWKFESESDMSTHSHFVKS